MKKFRIIVIASVMFGAASAQVIAGEKMSVHTHVKNNYAATYVYGKDGRPVSGARVVFENLNEVKVDEQKTNAFGKAVFSLPTMSQNLVGYVKARGRGTTHFELNADHGDFR